MPQVPRIKRFRRRRVAPHSRQIDSLMASAAHIAAHRRTASRPCCDSRTLTSGLAGICGFGHDQVGRTPTPSAATQPACHPESKA